MENYETPKVSLITVNYNGEQETRELLLSLRRAAQYADMEIIVVDNGSRVPLNLSDFPEVRLLRSDKNLGFAGGNNIGIQQARGEYVLLLNNDTEVDPHFLEPLIQALDQHPEVGIVSPKILFYHKPGIIQYAGCSPIHPVTSRGFAFGHGCQDDDAYSQSGPTFRAHGAAMLIRKDVFKDIGYLPEIYFLYYEEMDFCEKAKKAGYQIWYESTSRVYHKESITVSRISNLKTFYMSRNRLLFIRRNISGLNRILAISYFCIFALPKQLFVALTKGSLSAARATLQGVYWNLENKAT